jgi:copper oxidase (laccase) domain-containing protein
MTHPRFLQNVIPSSNCITFVSNRHISLNDAIRDSGLIETAIIEMEQTHEDGIQVVNDNTPSPVEGVDAIITTQKHTTLIVRTADCLPILIYHPTVIAGIHAGRKSTELNILEKTLKQLKETFNIKDGLHIYFGPHICKESYEINPETQEHFDLRQHNLTQLNAIYTPDQYTLYEANICTKLNTDTYYSYRSEGENAGRFYSGISRR